MRTWLKLIGMVDNQVTDYSRKYVSFSTKRPRHIHPGDHMLLYASGTKRVFGLAEVTSEVYDSSDDDPRRYPYRVNIRYIINLAVADGVDLDEINTSRRDIARSIRQASYIEIDADEYMSGATKLQKRR